MTIWIDTKRLGLGLIGGDKSPSDGNYPFTKELTEAYRLPEPFHNNHCYTVEILATQPYWAAR